VRFPLLPSWHRRSLSLPPSLPVPSLPSAPRYTPKPYPTTLKHCSRPLPHDTFMLTLPLATPFRWSVHNGEQLPPHFQLDSRRQEGNRRYRICIALLFPTAKLSSKKKRGFGGWNARVVQTPETERLFTLKLEDMDQTILSRWHPNTASCVVPVPYVKQSPRLPGQIVC